MRSSLETFPRGVSSAYPKIRAFSPSALAGYAATAAFLWMGWSDRTESYLSPREGLGYMLGITGAAFMLLLLAYSFRKRWSRLRRWGPLRHWFRVHMLLGVLGPVCILFHCNFRLGSINSSVALVCMLVVVASGFIGRFLYSRVHNGLYGKRANLETLRTEVRGTAGPLYEALASCPKISETLDRLDQAALHTPSGVVSGSGRLLVLAARTRWAEFRISGRLHARDREGKLPLPVTAVERYVDSHISALRRITAFSVYERLFALWHFLHVPLFVMLVVTGAVHVLAVHRY